MQQRPPRQRLSSNGVIGKFVYPGLQTDPTPNAGSIQTEGNRASRLELAELTALHRHP